ncbi:exodeoxyribonuclease III [Mesohalobacter halotolerans]|uniref:Exodeoxyribonuclease III n=1 Tax=Mesohalobacter halotolerans TaxID=1883405 RepID=A0A4U5TT95_9FLAO|nr:exodeoxyribonuclease III [Mesohalobacter halotolerans]MBS3738498.1 exodeoxyribonuclease III [Psychroflexus sp.]TKS57589.1 exodeoxyribonuclease III [Mesohalobacter halotolerans]
MTILSYNVNGIRAAMRKGLTTWLKATDADVVCFQETKAQEEQIDVEAFKQLGFEYCYWFSAQKKGYSGVGIISKVKPQHIEVGCGIDYMDNEGRILRLDFDNFSLMSLYLPSGTNDARLNLKFDFMADFYNYINKLKNDKPNLVICGDYNICHEPIDIHDPVRLKTVSGFLPEEREWLSKFLDSGFIDSFRFKNPEVEQYSWWSYRANARANNKGWRLDYHLVSEPLKQNIKRAVILPEAKHSDHCPVLLKLDF